MTDLPAAAGGAAPALDPELLERGERLTRYGRRAILGITGPPGAGKSTIAQALVAHLGGRAVLVPMDGFHLAQAELERLGRATRKGAPDTFDAAGFGALLERIHAHGASRPDAAADPAQVAEVIYAPTFDRRLEEPVAGAIPVRPETPLVVVEGNYLLHDDGAWARVAGLLDETWYVEVDDAVRIARLVARHVAFGKSPDTAEAWARGPDEANARLIARGRVRATCVVTGAVLGDWPA